MFLKTTCGLRAGLVIVTCASFAFARPPELDLLSQRRHEISFSAYTPEQKQLFADQAFAAIDEIYPHRKQKIRLYGPSANAQKRLLFVKSSAQKMSEVQLFKEISDAFLALRDRHTAFVFPKPYQCYTSFLPFNLAPVYFQKKRALTVTEVMDSAEIRSLYPDIVRIGKGDILEKYSGVPAMTFARKLTSLNRGANSSGGFRFGIAQMTRVPHNILMLPTENTVRVDFKKVTGEIVSLSVPWISRVNFDCLPQPTTADASATPIAPSAVSSTPSPPFASDMVLQSTAEPSLHWGIFRTQNRPIGYLRVKSFAPKVSTIEAVAIIRGLLKNELSQTDSLIIDVRSNGGGSLAYSENIAQLFTPQKIFPLRWTLENTPAQKWLFDNASPYEFPALRDALKNAQEQGLTQTRPVPISSERSLNFYGQNYFRPVAILTNGLSYSAADIVPLLIQFSKGGIVFGEEDRTGGGGSVIAWAPGFFPISKLPEVESSPFKKLPDSAAVALSWIRIMRPGQTESKGHVLEDYGVKSDQIVLRTLEDIFDGEIQIRRTVIEKLTALTAHNPRYKASAHLVSSKETLDIEPHQKSFEILLQVSGTEKISIGLPDQVLSEQEVKSSSVTLVVPRVEKLEKSGRLELIGFFRGERVWRKIIPYRRVPSYTVLASNAAVSDFGAEKSLLTLFTPERTSSLGWNVDGKKLRIGNGRYVQNDLRTHASYFLDLKNKRNLTLEFSYQGQFLKSDGQFRVSIHGKDEDHILFQPIVDTVPSTDAKFDLSRFAGQKVEIRFEFLTDATNVLLDRGFEISNLKIY